jgi:hypothetical protein
MNRKYLTPKQRKARILIAGVGRFGTKAAFARALKVLPTGLDHFLDARNPKVNTMIRVADVLGIPVSHLIEK